MSSSGAVNRKPTPAHGVQVARRGGVVAELLSQPAHVHVERLGRAEPVLVPHAVHQLLARDDAPGVADQLGQQVELLARELQLLAVEAGPPGGDVDVQAADLDGAGRQVAVAVLDGSGATQDRPDAGDHLGAAERLDHVVVGAELEPDDAVGLGAAGGQHQDRDRGRAADRAADVAPVAVGEREVEQHDREVAVDEVERLGRRAGDDRLEPLARQRLAERLVDARLVLDEENPRLHAPNVAAVGPVFPSLNPRLPEPWAPRDDGEGHEPLPNHDRHGGHDRRPRHPRHRRARRGRRGARHHRAGPDRRDRPARRGPDAGHPPHDPQAPEGRRRGLLVVERRRRRHARPGPGRPPAHPGRRSPARGHRTRHLRPGPVRIVRPPRRRR